MNKNHAKPNQYGLRLSIENGNKNALSNCEVAAIGKEITFDPNILNTYRYDGWASIHYDLLVVAAAVEYADRQRKRRRTNWSRHFDVTVPVIEFHKWQGANVQERLQDVLRQLTGDEWRFDFVRSTGPRNSADQGALPFPKNQVQSVIPYSDGLDSRCVSGLYPTEEIIRVRLSGTKNRLANGEKPFDLIPFGVKPRPSPENSVRSRGFKFAAVTAIASHLADVTRIIVPESGQGTLSPVLRPLHNIYPDYRNHPVFFRKMERFIEALLDHRISFEQPRLWSTKGQTVTAYMQTGAQEASLHSTRSCGQQRWNARLDGKLRQCGLCAACLLRRMSMHAASVIEPVGTYIISNLAETSYSAAIPHSNRIKLSGTMVKYGIVGVHHFQHLADISDSPDADLKVHTFEIARSTGRTESETLDNLRKLVIQHALEWRAFVNSLGSKSFINSWIVGGRHD